jgi:hypothetical protein
MAYEKQRVMFERKEIKLRNKLHNVENKTGVTQHVLKMW